MTTDDRHGEMVLALAADPYSIGDQVADMSEDGLNLMHGILGISTEAGELLDCLKKRLAYGKPWDETNLVEEFGDLEFYLRLCYQALNIKREAVLAANIRKLSKRYRSGRWTAREAEHRDLEAERAALEGA